MNFGLKAWLKKVKKVKWKHKFKADKTQYKAQKQAQINNICQLAIGNRQIGTYKNVLSDLLAIPNSNISTLGILFQ